jgi:hypothetical protein
MSIELIVLLFVFVVLPLLQQLIRAARQMDQRTPGRAAAETASEYEPETEEWEELEPPPRVLLPPTPAVPRPTAREQHKLLPVPARPPAQAATRRAAPAPAARRSARRHKLVASLRNPRGLRNAFVLATILGPCRANEQ